MLRLGLGLNKIAQRLGVVAAGGSGYPIPTANLGAHYTPAGWFQDTAGTTPASNNADPIARWNDQTANANHLLQATAGNRMSLLTNDLNGYAVVNGAAGKSLAKAFTLNQPYTLMLVMAQTAWSNNQILLANSAGGAPFLFQSSATPQLRYNAGASSNLFSLTLNTYYALTLIVNGASSVIRVNGTQITSGNYGASNPGGTWLGNVIKVAEYAIYNTAVSASVQQAVENYFSQKYGLGF